jgi:hypothetical protein
MDIFGLKRHAAKLGETSNIYVATLTSFFLCAAALLFAAIEERPLSNEGGQWVYEILNTSGASYSHVFFRYSDILFQIPSILAMRILGETGIGLATTLAELSYSLHPVVSILICAWILKRRERIDLILWPLLSFAIATMPTAPFSVGVVAGATSFFWPAFLLVCLSPRPSPKTTIAILAFSVLLLFSHESALALFVPLSLASLAMNGWRWPTNRVHRRLTVFFVFGLLSYLARLLIEQADPRSKFFSEVFRPWNSEREFGLALLLLTSLTLPSALGSTRSKYFSALLAAGTVLFTTWMLLFADLTQVKTEYGYAARASATSLATVIALLFLILFSNLMRTPDWIRSVGGRAFVVVTFLSLLAAAVVDYQVTNAWKESLDELRSYNTIKGCHFATGPYYNQRTKSLTEYTSVVLQRNARPDSIVFMSSTCPQPNYNPCEHYSADHFTNSCGTNLFTKLGRYRYESITASKAELTSGQKKR